MQCLGLNEDCQSAKQVSYPCTTSPIRILGILNKNLFILILVRKVKSGFIFK